MAIEAYTLDTHKLLDATTDWARESETNFVSFAPLQGAFRVTLIADVYSRPPCERMYVSYACAPAMFNVAVAECSIGSHVTDTAAKQAQPLMVTNVTCV